MTCDGCALKKCKERWLNVECDWKVDVNKIIEILEDYDIEIVKKAVKLLEETKW